MVIRSINVKVDAIIIDIALVIQRTLGLLLLGDFSLFIVSKCFFIWIELVCWKSFKRFSWNYKALRQLGLQFYGNNPVHLRA
ncbi:regulation of nuclear pre-mRNA domain-containing protein 2-like [Salvia divinorum]|uniref:Regulation of nuclear pre-mRNA domain-containing protein 2-like n=1 Tax=Salvia divinorum TaxID=28513 RepID=A0ABD1HBV2_SALDI